MVVQNAENGMARGKNQRERNKEAAEK